jgi:hypothetical protein
METVSCWWWVVAEAIPSESTLKIKKQNKNQLIHHQVSSSLPLLE